MKRWLGMSVVVFGLLAAEVPGASAATITACKKKDGGALRIAKRCRRSETKITLNTDGPKGDRGPAGVNGTNGTNGTNGANGSNGTNGINGANGQPQSAKTFTATAPAAGGSAALFTADGNTYTFACSPFFGGTTVAVITVTGSGTLFSQETFKRPNGLSSQSGDPTAGGTEDTVDSDGGNAVFVGSSSTASGSTAQKFDFVALTSTVVTGPTSTTLMYSRVLASPNGCTVRGIALTAPNA